MHSRNVVTVDNNTHNSNKWMVTISCQQKKHKITKSHLYEVIMYLKLNISSFKVLDESFETSGKYKQLHWHAICKTKPLFRYKPYTQYGCIHMMDDTFSIHWKRITSIKGAVRYIHKDSLNQKICTKW